MTGNGKKFIRNVAEDKALQEKLKNVDLDYVFQVAKEMGISLKREDLFIKKGELTDDELNAVSGGVLRFLLDLETNEALL